MPSNDERGADTATVETLTAQVQVLTFGNRQVTLSVYRQLDTVSIDLIEPWGRVNAGDNDKTWVVGRERETGALVRAFVPEAYEVAEAVLHEGNLSGAITVCLEQRRKQRFHDRVVHYNLTHRGQPVTVHESVIRWCEIDGHGNGQGGCQGWYTNGLGDQIDAVIAEREARLATFSGYKALQLIVLAGLR